MINKTVFSIRLTQQQATQFIKVCQQNNITPTLYLKTSTQHLTQTNNPTQHLQNIGLTKKESWQPTQPTNNLTSFNEITINYKNKTITIKQAIDILNIIEETEANKIISQIEQQNPILAAQVKEVVRISKELKRPIIESEEKTE